MKEFDIPAAEASFVKVLMVLRCRLVGCLHVSGPMGHLLISSQYSGTLSKLQQQFVHPLNTGSAPGFDQSFAANSCTTVTTVLRLPSVFCTESSMFVSAFEIIPE